MDLTNLNRDRRRKAPLDLSTMVYGKVPPQARDLEEAILGATLMNKDAFETVSAILKPECFYVDAHNRIFGAMVQLSLKSQPIDSLTVVEQLRFTEELDLIGGPYYINKLPGANAGHVEAWANIIFQKWLQREIIRVSGEAINNAYEDSTDAFELLDEVQANVNGLATLSVTSSTSHISDILVERFKRLGELMNRDDHLTGVPSGFVPIDRLTAGWQDTDLIIIAARPSVGKTAFALNLARNAALHKSKPTPTAFFSLEMSSGQLVDRMLSSESGIDLDKIVRAKLTDEELERLYMTGLQPLAERGLYIDDTPALNIYDLKTRCRKLKKEHGIGLIVIDYLQLMSGLENKTVKNREQEIANISRWLKAMAKELAVPVIALSQLSRAIETAKRDPQLSDLRESGAIEQDADMVMFLTRPDYQQTDGLGEAVTDMADIHIKKHRNGPLAKIPMRTVLRIQRWMTDEDYNTYTMNTGFQMPGNWKRIAADAGPKLYIQTGSKMNNTDDQPF
jgi:replicative DNA helicase